MAERRRPSATRLRRALAAGDSPLSAFSVRVAVLAVVAALLPGLGRVVAAGFDRALHVALAHPESADATSLGADVASLLTPLLFAAVVTAFAVGFVQTGLAVAFRRRGSVLERLFDASRLVDAALGLFLAAGVVAVAWYGLRASLPPLARHAGKSAALLDDTGNLCGRIAWSALAVAFFLAALDVVLRRALWIRRLSPTPGEARRELRETEGAPEPRRARRRLHDELTR
ncbi:MAG TPA: EscU/YscU/HrcU family type III secretion system export apparatus switch protein [Polyangiaceae bacterium]|nr:EscU/YscU/HrcU family type III secretion system export apparatus switch protein [Polyangiaceae bacterium]